jgi:hypothetical protein
MNASSSDQPGLHQDVEHRLLAAQQRVHGGVGDDVDHAGRARPQQPIGEHGLLCRIEQAGGRLQGRAARVAGPCQGGTATARRPEPDVAHCAPPFQ